MLCQNVDINTDTNKLFMLSLFFIGDFLCFVYSYWDFYA
jgi:hypothetical protein